jgi:hypothetical protein
MTTGKLTQPKVHEFLNFTTYKDTRDYSKKYKGTNITMSTSDEYIIHMPFWNMALFYPLMIVTRMRHNAYCFILIISVLIVVIENELVPSEYQISLLTVRLSWWTLSNCRVINQPMSQPF